MTIRTARDIVTDAETFADQPAILTAAWAMLMAERGCRVDPDRLDRPAHLVARFGPEAQGCDLLTAARAARIRARVRDHAALIGVTGPAPLILDPTQHSLPRR